MFYAVSPALVKSRSANTERELKTNRLMTKRSEILAMQIEVLYFEDCPNHLPTVERIKAVLREEGCSADVREVLVPNVSTAERVKFLGSPSVRVNGIDIEPGSKDRVDFGLMCRRYVGGVPSHELIRAAVQSASNQGGGEQ